jgi:hypothetical protein
MIHYPGVARKNTGHEEGNEGSWKAAKISFHSCAVKGIFFPGESFPVSEA